MIDQYPSTHASPVVQEPTTLESLARAYEELRPMAEAQLKLDRSLFFQVAKYAAHNSLSWDQAVESILKEIAEYGEDDVPPMRVALARAREQGRPLAVSVGLGL